MSNIRKQYPEHRQSVLSSDNLQRMELSKRNLKDLQYSLDSSLFESDIVLEWISRTPTISNTDEDVSPVSKRRKVVQSLQSVAPSGGLKYSTSYAHSLYLLGIMNLEEKGIIPSAPDHTEVCDLETEVSQLVSAPSGLPSLSTYMNTFFLKSKPNEETWVNFLCACLFWPKLPISSEMKVAIVNEFSGPFKSHDLHQLVREETAIKFPLVKRSPFRPASNVLQTPSEVDLRSKSDFVFAAFTQSYLKKNIRSHCIDQDISGISDNGCFCAVAIAAEVKATASKRSFAAAKSQWSSLAYLQILERISIKREASYVCDENICQYGYVICGMSVRVWKMGLEMNITNRRSSEILPKYFTFPVQLVRGFALDHQEDLDDFIILHKKLLRWWLGQYIPSYVKDIEDNAAAHPRIPAQWRMTWQDAIQKCSPRETIEMEDFDITRMPKEQSVGPIVRAEDERVTLRQNDIVPDGDGICMGKTKMGHRCRKRVGSDKYCNKHKE